MLLKPINYLGAGSSGSLTYQRLNLYVGLKALILMLISFSIRDIPFKCDSGFRQSTFFLVHAIASINYGINQEPITDINLLMPKLCQNLSTICEGSFCIPGVKKCVCDLRMPVSFGRYCLRQVDVETKCFTTSQCNHTIKEAVCIDVASNAILDVESSKFKLDQWQQLNILRQQSQSSISRDIPKQTSKFSAIRQYRSIKKRNIETKPSIPAVNLRNSPYEISYNIAELSHQNHTRRNFSNERNSILSSQESKNNQPLNRWPDTTTSTSSEAHVSDSFLTKFPTSGGEQSNSRFNSDKPEEQVTVSSEPSSKVDNYFSSNLNSETNARKKSTVKTPVWPPGICSCPRGFMFNSLVRKCLALSLADSHCLNDDDCKQFSMTHCSLSVRKCECDDPLLWDQKELVCSKPVPTTPSPPLDHFTPKRDNVALLDGIIPSLLLARLLPDHSVLLIIFVILVIVGTLIILQITVRCFSSRSSALISPKNKKKKVKTSNLPPKSPYATLRRPDHKPCSELSSFTQATRGRILNYDFEQEGPQVSSTSPQPQSSSGGTMTRRDAYGIDKSATLKSTARTHKHYNDGSVQPGNSKDIENDEPLELQDNISLSQGDSDHKADSNSLTIPAPPPTQQPPYMLTSAMKGQGSAIAAAAAAVANKRMQLAQKKNLEPIQPSGKIANGSPVFL